ncbi:MAG TPA: M48 family metalloprotease [Anaerolineae bacterium]
MRYRFPVTGLLFISIALWLVSCAEGGSSTGNDTSGAATVTSNPQSETLISRLSSGQATPTAFPLPTQVIEGPTEIIITREVTEVEEITPTREKIAETPHFVFYVEDGYLPVGVDELQEEAEVVFDYAKARLEVPSPKEKTTVSFRRPSDEPCAARGWAFFAETPQIVIFSDEETSREQLLGVFAHEVGHVLHEHGFEGGFSVHRGLNEGLANWAAAHYWNAGQDSPSFDASVRTYLEDSVYLPLYENYDLNDVYLDVEKPAEDCLRRRDILYTEWASFLDFLLQSYGMEKLRELFATTPASEITETQRIIRPPDYPAVYGSALNQLEAAWLEDIRRSQ